MAESLPFPAAPFDGAAQSYDQDFAATPIGRVLRQAVWQQLTPLVRPGMRVLDLGCGTGEDALWLARQGCSVEAADSSAAMLRQVEAKAAREGLENRITTCWLDLNADRHHPDFDGRFDLVLSNFGAWNCLAEPERIGQRLAGWVTPGGRLALNVMGRFCAWEFLWYLPGPKAWRRIRGRASATISGRTLDVYYWGARRLDASLAPHFTRRALTGIGIFLPPSYLFDRLRDRPVLMARLARWDAAIAAHPLAARMADHMLAIFERMP